MLRLGGMAIADHLRLDFAIRNESVGALVEANSKLDSEAMVLKLGECVHIVL